MIFKKFIAYTFILIIISTILYGCNFKRPEDLNVVGTDGFTETGDDIPTLHELTGAWTFLYLFLVNTCNDQTGEFTAEGTVIIIDENGSIIGVVFPEAGDQIEGPYTRRAKSKFGKNALNQSGSFSGMTDKVNIGEFLAQEFWEGTFFFGEENPSGVFYEGTSLVEVTDKNGNFVCTIEYEVEGERTGPLPQS